MGDKLADKLSEIVGSWPYIGIQTAIFTFWVFLNVYAPKGNRPDPYPFAFLNLAVGFMSAYTGPVLLISANRQSERDRKKILEDLDMDSKTEALVKHIDNHMHELNSSIQELKNQGKN